MNNEIDLHHFSSKDIDYLVNYLINEAFKNNIKEIRIIHGKGKSFKKYKVIKILENNSHVLSYTNDSYNWGATIAKIKTQDSIEND